MEENELASAINSLTKKISQEMLKEFLDLPESLQKNVVLIKSAQLLLANVLCQVVSGEEELKELLSMQGKELSELTWDCAVSGYSKKFQVKKH